MAESIQNPAEQTESVEKLRETLKEMMSALEESSSAVKAFLIWKNADKETQNEIMKAPMVGETSTQQLILSHPDIKLYRNLEQRFNQT